MLKYSVILPNEPLWIYPSAMNKWYEISFVGDRGPHPYDYYFGKISELKSDLQKTYANFILVSKYT